LDVSLPRRNGFIDVGLAGKALIDSAKDIRDCFKDFTHGLFEVVDSASNADMVVTVVGRGIGSNTYNNAIQVLPMPYGVVVWSGTVTEAYAWVRVILSSGEYKREIVGTHDCCPAWELTANKVVDEVEAWAKLNYNCHKAAGNLFATVGTRIKEVSKRLLKVAKKPEAYPR
jgi:hypothetical protein